MLDADVAFLLQDYGSDLTLSRRAATTYDPTTGTLPTPTTSTHTIRGVFIEYEDGSVDGTVIQQGDRKLLVQALDAPVTPARGDRVGGLEVLAVRTIAPNGTAIAWTCQMRA